LEENSVKKTVCGVGYLGDAKTVDETGKTTREYKMWHSMIYSCYGRKAVNKKVCPEWLCYANFLRDIKTLPNYELWLVDTNYMLHSTSDWFSVYSCKFITRREYGKELQSYSRVDKRPVLATNVITGQQLRFESVSQASRTIISSAGSDSRRELSIRLCLKGRRKTAYGYTWEYVEES
jgi:hypothetical protein